MGEINNYRNVILPNCINTFGQELVESVDMESVTGELRVLQFMSTLLTDLQLKL